MAISLDVDGSYSADTNQINISTTGAATYTPGGMTSGYTLTVNGAMMSDTEAEVTYSIDFSEPQWPDHSGNWSVTKTVP